MISDGKIELTEAGIVIAKTFLRKFSRTLLLRQIQLNLRFITANPFLQHWPTLELVAFCLR